MAIITPPNELKVDAVDELAEGNQRLLYTFNATGTPVALSEASAQVVVETDEGLQRAFAVYNLNSSSPATDIDVNSFKEGVIQTTLSDASTDEQIPTAAAAVSYVSSELANYTTTEDLNTLLADKLDKVATAGDTRAYGIGSDGSQTVYTISGTATASTIAIRNADGELAVATPTVYGSAATKKYVDDGLNGKQETLVSGTNIKTLNSTSLLGSGDLSIDGLPSQTGQSGKFLTTDGSSASWDIVPSVLPSQTGQSGKFLTTDGTDPSWAEVPSSGGGAAYLFQHQWSDHILTEDNWLRADTFDWHSGVTYPDAYNELLSEYNDPDAVSHDDENYTIVGSPTITNGIASGFSSSNYLQVPSALDTSVPWEYRTKIVVKNITTGQYFFQLCSATYSVQVLIVGTGNFRMGVSSNGTSWDKVIQSGTLALAIDDVYYVKLGWDGETYYVDYSTDNKNWTRDIGVVSRVAAYNNGTPAYITTGAGPYLGDIDLNYTSFINSSHNLWNARFVYKTTPKGYYITTPEFIQVISNFYTVEGKELYYLLDTTNTQFKLPRVGLVYSYFYGEGESDPLASPATLADTLPMANTDLSNISSAATGIISNGAIPDYSAGLTFGANNNYTCPSDGYILCCGYQTYLNGVSIHMNNGPILLSFPVHKGDIVKITSFASGYTGHFYPYKGAV